MDFKAKLFEMSDDMENEAFLRRIDEDLDFAFAVALQTQFAESDKNEEKNLDKFSGSTSEPVSKPLSIVDDQLELVDPHPDIHSLFLQFNAEYFYDKLLGVEVRWSPRMTLCAGLCSYEGHGGLCSIRLSLPLLRLRPRRDLVETLLHEMIHAYLFVTQNNKDHDSHGPEFLSHMFRINKATGTNITVYHNFHDEVDSYRTHWWKCNGSCQKKHPFYGIVKRAMNRAPGPNDRWWSEHQVSCGGTFTKIREPQSYSKKKALKRKSTDQETKSASSDIRQFFRPECMKTSNISNGSKAAFGKKGKPSSVHTINSIFSEEDNLVPLKITSPHLPKKNVVPFSGQGHKLGSSCSLLNPVSRLVNPNASLSYATFTSSKVANNKNEDNVIEYIGSETSDVQKYVHFTKNIVVSSQLGNQEETNSKQNPKENISTSPQNLKEEDMNYASSSQRTIQGNFHTVRFSEVKCPVCLETVKSDEINYHLDKCLLTSAK